MSAARTAGHRHASFSPYLLHRIASRHGVARGRIRSRPCTLPLPRHSIGAPIIAGECTRAPCIAKKL